MFIACLVILLSCLLWFVVGCFACLFLVFCLQICFAIWLVGLVALFCFDVLRLFADCLLLFALVGGLFVVCYTIICLLYRLVCMIGVVSAVWFASGCISVVICFDKFLLLLR